MVWGSPLPTTVLELGSMNAHSIWIWMNGVDRVAMDWVSER